MANKFVQVAEYGDICGQVAKLGLPAVDGVVLLPENLFQATKKEEFVYPSSSRTVRAVLRENNLEMCFIDRTDEPTVRVQKFLTWIGPIIYVAGQYLASHPEVVENIVNSISEILKDYFKGEKETRATLDIVIENKNGNNKLVHFDGPADQLQTVKDIVRETRKES